MLGVGSTCFYDAFYVLKVKFVLVELFFRLKPLSCICMYAFSLHVEALFIGSDAFVGLLETFTAVIKGKTKGV